MSLTKKEFAAMMDHSAVSNTCTRADVKKVCQETLDNGFATAYMLPCHVKWARDTFGPKLSIGAAIAFPLGGQTTQIKIKEGLRAIEDGADCLDVVICVPMLRSGRYEYCANELKEIVTAWKARKSDVVIKVICECNLLNYEQKVEAIKMVLASGADVIKTNTGFTGFGARVSDVRLMKRMVGDKMIVKAAGDCDNAGDAFEFIAAGARLIGNSAAAVWNMMNTFDQYYPDYEDVL